MPTNQDNQLFNYHLNLLKAFNDFARQQVPFNEPSISEEDTECLNLLDELCNASGNSDAFNIAGQGFVAKIVAGYSHLTPYLHRDLFWFFGGDCLHYMPDDEVNKYQALDERRHEAEQNGENFHYEDERAKVFGLH